MNQTLCASLFAVVAMTGCGGGGGGGAAQPPEHATCDCASPPCIGNTINVTVKATVRSWTAGVRFSDAQFKWRFTDPDGSDALCGRFANGDYWIAPRNGDAIKLLSVTGNGKITLDDDPEMEAIGLLSGVNNYGNYNPANNLIPQLPVSWSGRTVSLVAAKQRDEAADGACGTRAITGECVDAYDVVTVLAAAPAGGGGNLLRPNITGAKKELLSLDDFDFSRLPRSVVLKGADAVGLEAIRQRWSHNTEAFGFMSVFPDRTRKTYSEGGRAFRAEIVVDEYGSGMATAFNNDLMTVFSADNTFEEKRSAIAAMLVFGLDIYHTRYDPPAGVTRAWLSGAGQSNGKLLPPVFLAALMKDPAYGEVLQQVGPDTHAADVTLRGPSELRQISAGVNGQYIWGDDPSFTGAQLEGAYWGEMLNAQCFDGARGTCRSNSFGQKTQRDPYGYIDGPPSLAAADYAPITGGVQSSVVAAMFLMPEICHIVNYPPLVTYVDRLRARGAQVTPDACAAPDPAEDPATCDPYHGTGCKYYRLTWGPDPAHPGQCITGKGRFTAYEGVPVRLYYTSTQVEANWKALRGTSVYCE